MTYEEKIAAAKAIVKEDTWNAFLEKLQAEGGVNNQALALASWEDLEEMGLPRLTAKQVSEIFRKKDQTSKKPRLITPAKVQSMSSEELLNAYDPSDHTSIVAKRLAELSNNQSCIVFNNDRTINVEVSSLLLNEVKQWHPPRRTYQTSEGPQKVYKVGEQPGMIVDENPLYRGRTLRPDGTCDQTNRSWSGIEREIRIMVRLALGTAELRINTVNDAHDVLDLCMSEDALKKIQQRWNIAHLKYMELEAREELPSLKLELNQGNNTNANTRKNEPWGNMCS